VTGDVGGLIEVFYQNFVLLNSFQAHTDQINRIEKSPFNNDYVATCSKDTTVKIWNISNPFNWCLIQDYKNHTQAVFGLEWINEDTIASGGYDDAIKIWSMNTGETLRTIGIHSGVRSLKLLTNGFYMACGLGNNIIKICNISTGNLILTFRGHTSYVNDLIQINNDLLASSSSDGSVLIWDLLTYSIRFNLTGHISAVNGMKLVSFDILASGSNDNTIKLWNITNGQLLKNLTGHTDNILWSLDLLSDSQTLVSGSLDQTIKIWNLTTGGCLSTFNTGSSIRSLAILSPSFETTGKMRLFFILSRTIH